MPPSDLERFFERERRDLAGELEPHRELARDLDVFGQAVLGGWCELAHVATRAGLLEDRAEDVVAFYSEQAEGYEPSDPDRDRFVVPIYFGSTLNGLVEDLDGGRPRVDGLRRSLEQLHRILESAGDRQGSLYGGATFHTVFSDGLEAGISPEALAPAMACALPWQRVAWLVECAMRQGAVIARNRGEPLIGDSYEQLTYLLRLAANQPGLANWPELARFVPRRADGMLALSEQAYRRFRREGIPDDPALAARLVEEIIGERHYVLDGMSVIELEELGVKRIVLTPEERPDASPVEGYEPAFVAGFLVDHVAGSFAGTITIGGDTRDGRNASIMVPAILEQTGRELEELSDGKPGRAEADIKVLHEAQAAVELLLLAAWRDLVVPEVREQHYEIDRVRKAKGGGSARAAKRGNLEVVRYLPRRLVYRRAAREAAEREGRSEPKRVYAVSAFARRLPEGQKRSRDASDYAKEIGIPLAPHQTVVRPHLRGGSEEEREAAMDAGLGIEVRRWKSWSALDLLRTRAAA